MPTELKIGDIQIAALSDGLSRLPRMFYPGLDFEAHPEVLDDDGTVHIPTGVDRAYLLGDAVQCPLQLTETDISFLTDVDTALAARTRETLFREMEREQAAVGKDHFPGLEFQRILTGTGRRWVTV
jgi:hypothetical protein